MVVQHMPRWIRMKIKIEQAANKNINDKSWSKIKSVIEWNE